jgi:hypothetical protein
VAAAARAAGVSRGRELTRTQWRDNVEIQNNFNIARLFASTKSSKIHCKSCVHYAETAEINFNKRTLSLSLLICSVLIDTRISFHQPLDEASL